MRRTGRRGLSPVAAGVIALVVAVVGTYLGFTKAIPFKQHYEIKAVFETANNLKSDSKVRIAGVDVGKVTEVKPLRKGADEAVVTMRLQKKALPLHKDARFAIRPRIFLEGNFFVDIDPGTPSSPVTDKGEVFPVNQTRTPVQFDQLLTALQSDTREDLRVLLREYSSALAEDGARGYNRSIPWWKPAYRDSAVVNDALRGQEEHDLSEFVKDFGTVAGALDRNPEQLKSLITDFNTTAEAFAREQGSLEATVAELPRTLRAAQPALASLNRAFPPTRRLARDFLPGVRSSGPTIDASMPLVRQLRRLVSRRELRGLVRDLRPTVPALARLNRDTIPLQRRVREASSCQNEVILPWAYDKIQDAQFPATGPVYEESVKFLPGIAGESRSGDANGPWIDILAAQGNYFYPTGPGRFLFSTTPIQGVNPPPLTTSDGRIRYSPFRPDVPCETQQAPDLRTVPLAAPSGSRIATDTPAARKRYAEAKDVAMRWLRRELRKQGAPEIRGVTDRELTREQLERIKREAGK